MPDFIAILFDTTGFHGRWQCGSWTSVHGWTHIISHLAIFAAYAAMPCVLACFMIRRRCAPFLPAVCWLFVGFILFSGIVHLVEATIFWHPWYRLSAAVKVCTAVISWATVIALLPIVPRALALPGLKVVNRQLQESNQELQRFARAMVDREERIIALKQEVNVLLQEMGRETRYGSGSAGT